MLFGETTIQRIDRVARYFGIARSVTAFPLFHNIESGTGYFGSILKFSDTRFQADVDFKIASKLDNIFAEKIGEILSGVLGEELIENLMKMIKDIDEEGLIFLTKQANVLLYNMRVEEINKKADEIEEKKVAQGKEVQSNKYAVGLKGFFFGKKCASYLGSVIHQMTRGMLLSVYTTGFYVIERIF